MAYAKLTTVSIDKSMGENFNCCSNPKSEKKGYDSVIYDTEFKKLPDWCLILLNHNKESN